MTDILFMIVTECIILAGGLGTRLHGILKDVPKPMAPIRGKPFLEFLIDYLKGNGIKKVVLSIGYKASLIVDHFTKNPRKDIEVAFSIEDEPLGTGGGVKKALNMTRDNSVLVVNGDTLFDVKISGLCKQHEDSKADVTLALKKLDDCSRYGRVEMDDTGRIKGFTEKGEATEGFINGGICVMNRNVLDGLPARFSFEKDLLSARCEEFKFYGHPSDGYFIDIGIPEDYEKAQKELV